MLILLPLLLLLLLQALSQPTVLLPVAFFACNTRLVLNTFTTPLILQTIPPPHSNKLPISFHTSDTRVNSVAHP